MLMTAHLRMEQRQLARRLSAKGLSLKDASCEGVRPAVVGHFVLCYK
jgi:hypothetical protein